MDYALCFMLPTINPFTTWLQMTNIRYDPYLLDDKEFFTEKLR